MRVCFDNIDREALRIPFSVLTPKESVIGVRNQKSIAVTAWQGRAFLGERRPDSEGTRCRMHRQILYSLHVGGIVGRPLSQDHPTTVMRRDVKKLNTTIMRCDAN